MAVMTVGFLPSYLPRFAAGGLDVAVFVYSGPTPPEPTRRANGEPVHAIDEGVRFALNAGAFDPTLDPAVAARARDTGLAAYGRAHVRSANRENRSTPEWGTIHNYFELAINYWSEILKKHRIDTVLFWIIPHEGSFVALYHLARAMGLRTPITFQSIYPNAFWMFESLEEYGLSDVIADHGLEIPMVDRPDSPFYTRTLRDPFSRIAWARDMAGAVVDIGLRAATLQFLWRRYSMTKSVTKAQRIWRKFEHQALGAERYVTTIDDENLIYFPLHLQPEASADIIGGRYCDQMLAVEELARLKPDGFAVYVKENPRQTSLLRGETFFVRAASLPGVKLMRHHVSTFELIDRSRIVATITGTAGYEALQMGKPVLCFGYAWYRGLPGVFDWTADPKRAMAEALAFRFDRETLRAAVAERARRLWRGVVDPYYVANTPGYDREVNLDVTAASILEYFTRTRASRA